MNTLIINGFTFNLYPFNLNTNEELDFYEQDDLFIKGFCDKKGFKNINTKKDVFIFLKIYNHSLDEKLYALDDIFTRNNLGLRMKLQEFGFNTHVGLLRNSSKTNASVVITNIISYIKKSDKWNINQKL